MNRVICTIFFVLLFNTFNFSYAHHTDDTEYFDVTITGLGFIDGESGFYFTINDPDKPEAANLVFTADEYSEERKIQLYSLVLSAYMSNKNIKLITWGAIPKGKYVNVRRFIVGRDF